MVSMRVLGLDVGDRRIGVAISDVSAMLARPLRTMVRDGSVGEVVTALATEIRGLEEEEDGLTWIVIGLPRRLDGSAHEQTDRVLAFADALRAQTSLPITLQDERLTSHEAERRLALREPNWRKRKARLDAAAAAVILQDYLDQRLEMRGQRPEAVDQESGVV